MHSLSKPFLAKVKLWFRYSTLQTSSLEVGTLVIPATWSRELSSERSLGGVLHGTIDALAIVRSRDGMMKNSCGRLTREVDKEGLECRARGIY